MEKNKPIEEREKQIAIKIIRGHLKLITKYVACCLERLERLEKQK